MKEDQGSFSGKSINQHVQGFMKTAGVLGNIDLSTVLMGLMQMSPQSQ